MSGPAGKIQAIHRYPVEGLTPEPLPRATLAVRQTIPCDRIYAIENGPSGFDAAEPGRARRPSDAGGARRDRNILCGILRRRIARAGQGAARGGPQLFRRGAEGDLDHQPRLGRGMEEAAGAPVHPLRFRGNLQVAGWPAWQEFDLLNAEIAIGPSARLKVVKRIVRCAATEVDPDTGIRDLPVPRTLRDYFGHVDCGVYAQVIEGGAIAVGDAIT